MYLLYTALVYENPAEDFDLDSLLYDIVKFDPSKVVQEQVQPQQMSAVANNAHEEVSTDLTDSGASAAVNEGQSPQDGNISL